jgi:hypothetical protein
MLYPLWLLKPTLTRNRGWMVEFEQNWTITFNHGKMEIGLNINSVVIPSSRQSNKQNACTGTRWSRNSMAQKLDVCGRVYRKSRNTKRKPATSRTLPDKLNTFLHALRMVPPPRLAKKDCLPPPSQWLKWVKHINVLTLAGLLAKTAFLATSSEHAQISWLVCLRTYSISPYPSLLSPHASIWLTLFLYARRLR